MIRKIFGLLIFPILGASVHTYAQEEYDQQIFQYINQEKWFDAKSLYDTHDDDLSEVIRLISGAFLGAYFNRPAEGVAAVEELLAKYGGQLGGQAVMYRMLMAKNLAPLRAYAKIDSVFTYMLAYDAPYLDDQTRKGIASGLEQCRKIARLPRMEVIDRSREGSPGTVGMELEDGLFYLNADYCGKSVKTLLDIGAEYTSIDQSLADELGVRIFQDSLRMSPASYMKLGILDSLQIGSITLKNEICCVFPDGLAARDREAAADSGITRIRAMLGISTLRKLSALTVDVEHGTITFDTGKQPQTGIANFMLKDNIPYLWLELNGIPAMMHWDTGMNAKPRLSGKFYAEHASSLPELGPVRRGVGNNRGRGSGIQIPCTRRHLREDRIAGGDPAGGAGRFRHGGHAYGGGGRLRRADEQHRRCTSDTDRFRKHVRDDGMTPGNNRRAANVGSKTLTNQFISYSNLLISNFLFK